MISVVDLDRAADAPGLPGTGRPPAVVIAFGSRLDTDAARYWLDRASLTVCDGARDAVESDRRAVWVQSAQAAAGEIARRCETRPLAAAICDDVLRSVDPDTPAERGVIAESLGYSVLQAGPEFGSWLAARGPGKVPPETAEPVRVSRVGERLELRLNRPERHNAFSNPMRAGLLDGLTVAVLDDTVREVVLSGLGPSFCSGGDLAEFGSFADVAGAHLARTRHSPALMLDAVTARLGSGCRADIHGQVLGSGLEMAAYCGWVRADPATVLGLPELELGLIPGAGGTVSVTRRVGRWRTAYLVLSGRTVDAATALRWGLVDEVAAVAGMDGRR